MDRAKKIVVIAGLMLALAALAGNYLRFSTPPEAPPLGLQDYRLSRAGGERESFEVEPMDTEFLDLLGAREVSFRTYGTGTGRRVWVFMGYFDKQKEGSQVHSPRHCYPGSGWNILQEDKVPAPWGEGEVERLVVSDGDENRLVYYWFQTPTNILNDVYSLKYYLTRQAVLRHPQDLVFVRVSTDAGGNPDEAEALVQDYSRRVEGVINGLYGRRAQ
ncbi:MAG: EpsI family protein [Candidatus Latescibacterota bacterium]|jgi:EpsI family protein